MSTMVWSSNLQHLTKQLKNIDLESTTAKRLMEALTLSEKKAVTSTFAKKNDEANIKNGYWV
ncbi:hypothetical protein [Paenibacillus eucommiae]|uniref:Uncharacterized protein n=1 Tax=Paenibacillus eucommiae TaxID=1355755 RepID=A0ABS4J326_9BACL|nr:hypothetical protein [Paenibacillus eucommiae]MBP1994198.1 hypothetical protein [Paenibacillus eucommiae]